MLQIPPTWDEVTPAWMTAALSQSLGDIQVSDVEVLLVDDGTNRRARLGLSYASGTGPNTVFVKAADPDHAKLNLATGGLFNEPRLFASDVALPLDHPKVHTAVIDEPGLDFMMVMEDITARGGDPRDSTRPLTIGQAAKGVAGLARLHSAFWDQRLDAHDALSWVEPFVAWRHMGAGIAIGLERCADSIPPEVQALTGDQIETDIWFPFVETLLDGPQTLLHGDPHIGNTYMLPNDEVGFLDWQVLRRGNFSVDLGYFLQGALTVKDRRAGEADLIDAYHSSLDLPAGERPSTDEIWLRYRASAAHGLAIWMATSASDTWQRPEVSLPLARRYAAACADLDTASAINKLRGDNS